MAYLRHPSKEKEEKKPTNNPLLVCSTNTHPILRKTNDNESSRRQKHHDTYHNQPDPPADLDLVLNTPHTNKGASWPNHCLIGSYQIPANRTRNAKKLYDLITGPINPNEISARNTKLNNWILIENLRIINFVKKYLVCIKWEDFKLDKRY